MVTINKNRRTDANRKFSVFSFQFSETLNRNRRTGANGKNVRSNSLCTKLTSALAGYRKSCSLATPFGRIKMSLCTLLLALFLAGCTKDDMDNLKADAFDGKITAKVENGASYNSQISTVWALLNAAISNGQLTGVMAAQCNYANGGFTIDLPAVPAQYLMDIQSFFTTVLGAGGDAEYSNPGARLIDIDFFGISSSNDLVDFFIYAGTGAKRTVCLFVFADSDVTVKGGKNVAVMLRQGWNRIYVTPSENRVFTNAPKGMKWYINSEAQ